jgi:nitrile hydratase
MDGVHDVGGMHGFGRVERERGGASFHADWEKRVFGMMIVAVGAIGGSIDEFRHAVERMDPARYLAAGYWEQRLDGLERMVVEKGVLTPAQLEARACDATPSPRVEGPALVAALRAVIRTGIPSARAGRSARFAAGDRVVVRRFHPAGHTRCPRYVRGAAGVVARCHGSHVLPDAHAHGRGESPEPLYTVRFDAAELWGPDAGTRSPVYVDLWESYLT